jgi:hypothetical protein
LLTEITAILDVRLKLVLIQCCFPLIYQDAEATKDIELVKRILNEIYDVYLNEHNLNFVEQNLLSNAKKCSSHSSSINAFEGPKSAFNTQKIRLKKKNTYLVKKLKALLRIKKFLKIAKTHF